MNKFVLPLALGLLIASPPGWAENPYSRSENRFERQRSKSENKPQSTQALRGTIQDVRTVQTRAQRGAPMKHTVAKVQLDSGRMIVANLGPERKLQRLDLQPGDPIHLRGKFITRQGRSMFVADQVRANGQRAQTRADAAPAISRSARHQLTGTIQGFRQVNVRTRQGERAKHSLVRLQLDDQRMVVVDLGPKKLLDRLNLEKGQKIRVTAYPATLDGRPILLANRVAVPERTANQRAQFTSRATPSDQQTRTVRGTITGFRQVPLRDKQGERAQHALVRLQLENGRLAVVDLGPKRRLDDLNLQKGDRVQVVAIPGRIDGRPALIANRIQIGDQSRTIQRPGTRTQRQQQQLTVQGTVSGYRLVTLGADGRRTAILNLQLDDGRSLLIDAGAKYTPGELNLQKLDVGDRVTITGRRAMAGGQPVIVAEQIDFRDPNRTRARGSRQSRSDYY